MHPEPSWIPYTVTHESGFYAPREDRFSFSLPRERSEFDRFLGDGSLAKATHLHVRIDPKCVAGEVLSILANVDAPSLVGLGLHIMHQKVSSESLRNLMKAAFFRRLLLLHLEAWLSCEQVGILAAEATFDRLRRLRLRMFEPLDERVVRSLADAPTLATLSELILWVRDGTEGNRIGELLGASTSLQRLRHVGLRCLTDAGARAFLAARDWTRDLVELDLGGSTLGPSSVTEIANAQWPKLERLCLTANTVGDDGAVALATSTGLGGLTNLALDTARMTEVGLAAILSSHAFPELTFLDLQNNHRAKPDVVVAALLHATGFPKLEMIDLSQCNIRQSEAPFKGRPNLPNLPNLRSATFGHQEYE